jgi:hypothetical protein
MDTKKLKTRKTSGRANLTGRCAAGLVVGMLMAYGTIGSVYAQPEVWNGETNAQRWVRRAEDPVAKVPGQTDAQMWREINLMNACKAEGAHAAQVWENLNRRQLTADEIVKATPESLLPVTRRAIRDWRTVAAGSISVRNPVYEATDVTANCLIAQLPE